MQTFKTSNSLTLTRRKSNYKQRKTIMMLFGDQNTQKVIFEQHSDQDMGSSPLCRTSQTSQFASEDNS